MFSAKLFVPKFAVKPEINGSLQLVSDIESASLQFDSSHGLKVQHLEDEKLQLTFGADSQGFAGLLPDSRTTLTLQAPNGAVPDRLKKKKLEFQW